jgi:hypothetical protein
MAEIHDPEMTPGEGTRPDTRQAIARRALRELAFVTAGWAAGAWVLWRFGQGPLRSNLGLIFLALAIAFGVGVVLTSLWERRLPRWPGTRKGGYDTTVATMSLLGCFTWPAVARIVNAYDTLTAFEAWTAFAVLLILGFGLQYGPQLVRPQGFVSLRPTGATPVVGMALVAGLVIVGVGAWWIANGIVAGGQLVPLSLSDFPPGVSADALADIQPTMPTIALIGWALIVTMAGGGLVLWWAGVPRPFFACLAALYIAEVLWSEVVWHHIGDHQLVLGQSPGGLAILQALSAVLLITALPTASMLRPGRVLDRFTKTAAHRSRTAQSQLP